MISLVFRPTIVGEGNFALLIRSDVKKKITKLWREYEVRKEDELYLYSDPAYYSSSIYIGVFKNPLSGCITES